MNQTSIIDTGIIVAYLNRREKFYEWTKDRLDKITPPMLTCEAVIAETCFLMKDVNNGTKKIFELFETGLILIPFRLENELERVQQLMLRYTNIPMSFADACIVRMT